MPDRPTVPLTDELSDTPGIAICDILIFMEFGFILSLQSCGVIEPTTSESLILTRLPSDTCVKANYA